MVLGGCVARETPREYQRKVLEAYELRTDAFVAIEKSGGRSADQYIALGESFTTSADDLDALEPPNEVTRAHTLYITSLRRSAAILTAIGECMNANRSGCTAQVDPREVDRLRNDFMEADAIYRVEGYELPETEG